MCPSAPLCCHSLPPPPRCHPHPPLSSPSPLPNHLRLTAIPHIRPGGTITLVSGSNATKPGPNTTQAAAVNGALESLGRALAGDLAPRGIRVNVLSPGVVWTDLQLRVRSALLHCCLLSVEWGGTRMHG